MRKAIKQKNQLIQDLGLIINACNDALINCKDPIEYNSLKRDLIISYEERERLLKEITLLSKQP